MDLECPENTVFKNLCSLRMLAAKKFTQIYLKIPVLGKWVLQVRLRRFSVGRDSLDVSING